MSPLNNELPLSIYEAKKTLNALGMEYEKIHACPNDCILYRNDLKDASSCPTCGTSRWKLDRIKTKKRKGVPTKVMWYFPPIPRFRRLFPSLTVAKDLIWRAQEREFGEKLRHPSDSPSWKLVNHIWPDFASEPRNLRLAISADGKTKDGLNSRLDLLEMGLRCELGPSKVVDVLALDKLQNDVVVTLCLLEKYFLPSFFDIMLHFIVHLVRDVRLCGPVYLRWMYPFERFMKVLRGLNVCASSGCNRNAAMSKHSSEWNGRALQSKFPSIGG
ncbi:hypothetical protein CK203_059226 [Vitis vinifera]|uniref:DUF4218 domain-containing protein n=1 Tax=Vitis vinifera TaxID=29760 RepID=A0A438GEA8_VITVI|nr:hypothetical protein CK203_059226 [Vitis vinifera]